MKKSVILFLLAALIFIIGMTELNAFEVPFFSQNDPQWAEDQLGDCRGWYIGWIAGQSSYPSKKAAGCATTSKAMVFNYYQPDYTDPGSLNICLTQNGGYAKRCLAPWDDRNNICAPPGVFFAGHIENKKNQEDIVFQIINSELSAGRPVIALVKAKKIPSHFVVITGVYGDTYDINDPWDLEFTLRTLDNGALGAYTIKALWLYEFSPVVSFTPRSWLGSSVIDDVIFTIGGGTCEGAGCGNFGGAETSIVETYDTLTNSWMVKSPLETPRFGLTTSEVNGKIYAIGGTNGGSSTPVSSVEEYDPLTDNWTMKTTMPTPRWKLTSSVVDGLIYAIGGGSTGNQCQPSGITEKYDPVNDIWETKNPMLTDRWGAASAVLNGQIYVVGGSCACPHIIVDPSSALEAYDPSTDAWAVKSPMPTPRWDLAAAVVNGKIYAIGGWDPYSETTLQAVEEYDPSTDAWAVKSPMPTARTGLIAVAINGEIYAFGGFDGSQVTGVVEVYDPVADAWLSITP